MKFTTRQIHAGVDPDPITGSILTPIYQTTTYVQESVDRYMSRGYSYSRSGNPTVRADVHHRYRDALKASVAVGATHWDAAGPRDPLPGAEPTLFFAPAIGAARAKASGQACHQSSRCSGVGPRARVSE